MSAPEEVKHVVYTYYAKDGTVLYVGCTGRPQARDDQHRAQSMWYPLVARLERTDPMERSAAYECERETIARLSPMFNVSPGGEWGAASNLVSRLGELGISYRQLDYWCRVKTVKLRRDAKGSGSRREVSEAEFAALRDLADEIAAHALYEQHLRSGAYFAERLAVAEATLASTEAAA